MTDSLVTSQDIIYNHTCQNTVISRWSSTALRTLEQRYEEFIFKVYLVTSGASGLLRSVPAPPQSVERKRDT